MSQPIVVGIDFSPASRRALEAAARLAHDLEASLILVHAHNAPQLGWAASEEHLDAVQKVLAELQVNDVMQLSNDWARSLREEGLQVEVVHEEAHPATLLVDTATKKQAALIVVGHHGWGAIKRFILGSIAKSLLERSHVPVLVVPEISTK